MKHLQRSTLAALLDGTLDPGDARLIRKHLEGDCPHCSALLQESGPDMDTLIRLLEAEEWAPAEPHPDELEAAWASISSGLPMSRPSGSARGGAGATRRSWRWPASAVGLLAAAALLLVLRPAGNDHGLKGGMPSPPSVELRVVAGRQTEGGFQLEGRLTDGDTVLPDRTLLFEMETDKVSARYLFAIEGDGEVTILFPHPGTAPELAAAGSARVGRKDSWVALELDDMNGPLTLLGAASSLALDPELDILRPWLDKGRSDTAAYDSLTLKLQH